MTIVTTTFCFIFKEPEQAIAQVSTHSVQLLPTDKSTIQQQNNTSSPIIYESFIKVRILADDISNRLNAVASILENTSKQQGVRNIHYANSINKTLHDIPYNLDTAKRKIAHRLYCSIVIAALYL
jgi:hypothetical protein